jgi:exonuclease III
MNNNRFTKVLFWNIRGINSQEKWDALRDKILESSCQVLCIQETKRENFDHFYLKKICPRNLDSFAFSPSVGASGGLLIVWNSSLFYGTVVQTNSYAITISLLCRLDKRHIHVTNIYGPAYADQKLPFITWLMNFDTTSFDHWTLGGDFNLIRSPKNRNKQGGDIGEMNLFNEMISDLDLVEIPFSGRNFT